MNKFIGLMILWLPLPISPLVSQDLDFPSTMYRPELNTYHGYQVVDGYQWLEKNNTAIVDIWVDQQTQFSLKTLKKYANRNNSINLINRYSARERRWNSHQNLNFNSNSQTNFRLFYDDLFSAPSIYFRKNTFNKFRVLVDPRDISKEDNIMITSFVPSKDEAYLAYSYTRGGSDWREIKVKSTLDFNSPIETIENVKFSNITWYQDGFFYKKYQDDGNVSPSIYYHKLFNDQDQDSLIFKSRNPRDELYIKGDPDEEFYFLEIENTQTRTFSYLYYDTRLSNNAFKMLHYKIDHSLSFVDFIDDRIVAKASINNLGQLITFGVDTPNAFKVITPEIGLAQMIDFEIIEDKIVIAYQELSQPYFVIISLDGEIIKRIDLPDGVSVSSMSYQKATKTFNFMMESYIIPSVICELDLTTYDYQIIERTGVNFEFQAYNFSIQKFPSKDGTIIPIFIVHKGELSSEKARPFLLDVYGGHGVISVPNYDPKVIYFIEEGGTYGFVHARGGGELGFDWWNAGRNDLKQNTVDDVISAAKYVKEKGYASKIGITGASHGGLIAASSMCQEPQLFDAAVIRVALLDMLKYEQFSIGTKWIKEFGSVADSLSFLNLASISPYHLIKTKSKYPAVLLTTSKQDDRVVPMHTYKFGAALQNVDDPSTTLIWSQPSAGHSGASDVISQQDEDAYISGFLHQFLIRD